MAVTPLVGARWLANRILPKIGTPTAHDRPIRVIDATWMGPGSPVPHESKLIYQQEHIPGAVHFDIDDCSDPNTELERMLPPEDDFEYYVGKTLGVSNNHHVVVYDRGIPNSKQGPPLYTSFRVWWMFRAFNHHNVSVLDGGLSSWIREGLPVNSEVPLFEKAEFEADLQEHLVVNLSQVLENIRSNHFQLMDARANSRWRQAQIPNSTSVPMTSIFAEDGTIKSPENLLELFKAANVDLDKPLASSCGSGVTACGSAFAAHLCGKTDVAVFDGSMSEFAAKAGHLVTKAE